MVRRALAKSTLREIGGSLGRYLAILLIIALGVGFFAGLRSAQPAMVETGEKYLQAQSFQDFRLLSTLGFTEEDAAAFSREPGVTAAAGGYSVDFLSQDGDGGQWVLRAHSLTEGIDLPSLQEGRMPQSPEECLADARVFSSDDLGTEITLSPENDPDAMEALNQTSFTIVGLALSPRYLNYERGTSTVGNGTVTGFLYLLPEAFTGEAYQELLIKADLPGGLYSLEYEQAREALSPRLEALLEERAEQRYETLRSEIQEELDTGREELRDGWAEYRDGKEQAERELQDAADRLDAAERELQDGRAQVRAGESALADARETLDSSESQLADAERELARQEQTLTEGKAAFAQAEEQLREQEAQLADAQKTLDARKAETLDPLYAQEAELQAAVAQLEQALAAAQAAGAPAEEIAALRNQLEQASQGLTQVQDGIAQAEAAFAPAEEELRAGLEALSAGKAQLEEQRAALASGESALEEGKAQLEEGRREIAAGKRELTRQEQKLRDAREEVRRGEEELQQGREEYETARQDAQRELQEAERELLDGEAELSEGEEQLSELKKADTYLLTRDDNVGYACFENDTAIVEAISVVFPFFFFLVAAFVCVTTMTRMVEERRTQTGVLKALGYGNGRIMGSYLFYSGSAAVLGWLMGYFLGVLLIPRVIWSVYGIMYGFAPLRDVFSPGLFLTCLAAALLCSCGTVALVCRTELRETAAGLIRPKSARAGKTVLLERIRPLWRRLSFLKKVSVRNIFRYKNRLMMMLIGIGGCTALLLTGFGIRDSIQDIVGLQFEKIQHFDFSVTFTEAPEAAALEAAAETPGVGETLPVHQAALDAKGPEGLKSVQLLVSSRGDFQGMMDLRRDGAETAIPGAGEALMSQALAEALGLRTGDRFTLRQAGGGEVTLTLADTFENYVYYYVILSPEGYEAAFQEPPEYATLLARSDGSRDVHETAADLAGLENAGNVSVSQDFAQRMGNMLQSLNYIVVMVVLCAAALAFIVLYNLTNINITERTREIATLKVLGFYPRETADYIFREILVLSAMGAVVGVPLGFLLHRFVMAQIRVDLVSFPVQILPGSVALALGLTLLFALVLSLSMRRRLDKIDMVESLKSVE